MPLCLGLLRAYRNPQLAGLRASAAAHRPLGNSTLPNGEQINGNGLPYSWRMHHTVGRIPRDTRPNISSPTVTTNTRCQLTVR